MTGQLPPCAYDPAACGYDDEPGTCPCLDYTAPPEIWDEPDCRPVTDVPTGSYL
ncbi:hypothetical protein [Streptomyces sp. W1SF4]|uniref:hypothetical protein n=1 Tax=Streptomyces sp. W1SF4 TaxID=2305220 RepID=UPI0013DF3468|nr:hypothetical protein [Streptomyces sp. W1SF4]